MILYASVIMIVLGSIDRFFYQPIMNLFNEVEQEILSQEIQLRKNMRFLAAREAISNRYSAYAAFAVTTGSDEEEVAGLLNEVEGVARKSGLALLNMKPKPAFTTEFGKQYPVEVEVETEMSQLIKFIYGLQNSKYILGVKKLRLVPKGKKSSQIKGYVLVQKTVIR